MYFPFDLNFSFFLALILRWSTIGILIDHEEVKSQKPSIQLDLAPRWNDLDVATRIETTMSIAGRQFRAHEPMLRLVMETGRVPSMNYTGDDSIRSVDDQGELELLYNDDPVDTTRTWYPVRDTVGKIRLGFTVYPRETTVATPPGPRIDFRTNDGGLVGTGNVFIPTVLEPTLNSTTSSSSSTSSEPSVYDLDVRWDLTDAPPGTTTVWTFGEGPHVHYSGTMETLVNSVYMVGPSIRSHVDPTLPGFGFYYLTAPPAHFLANPKEMAGEIARLFPAMTTYFDRPSDTYRVFLRESPRGFGGSAFQWSFIIEWDRGVRIGREGADDDSESESRADDLYFLVSHEMAHNWPSIQGPPGDQEDANTTWFEEGIATYYQAVLPFDTGLIPRHKIIEQMNDILSAYYTSPAIALTSVECARDAWTNAHAQRLPYYRGALYLLHLDAAIRRDSEGRKSLRDPVNEMIRRRFSGESYTFDDLFRVLADYTDTDEAMDLYMNMSAGGWVVPPPNQLLGMDTIVRRQDQRPYEAGYTTTTDRHGDVVINSVSPGSNADLAGCRVGDVLTWSRYSYGAMDDYGRNVTMTLRRPGRGDEDEDEFSVDFWPRAAFTVPTWLYE